MKIYLKQLVYNNCMSLKQFSEKCNIPYATIHGIAANKRPNVQLNTLEKICKSLNFVNTIKRLSSFMITFH